MFSAYSYIEECLVAAPNEKSFQIEFYVLDNADDTKKFYNSNLSNIIETTGNSISDYSDKGNNYAKTSYFFNGKYISIEYVEKTIIYVPWTDSTNKSAVEEFLKEMNY